MKWLLLACPTAEALHWVQALPEGGDHSEISTTSTRRPEEIPVSLALALASSPPAVTTSFDKHRDKGASAEAARTHQTWRQLLEKCQDVPAPQVTAHNHLARGVNAVYLKYRLGDIEADCGNRLLLSH
jgi:hypothetical protein